MSTNDRPYAAKNVFFAAGVGAAAAIAANFILYFAGLGLGVTFEGEFGPGVNAIPVAGLVGGAIVPALAGAGLLLALNRWTQKPGLIFTIISVVFTLLSFGSPLGVPGISTGSIVFMELMHVASAAAIAGALVVLGRKPAA